jgi:hypothetical protein
MAKKNKIKTLVNHPMDHPDVIAYAKKRKKEREEIKEEYPILSKLIAPRGDDKKRAKGFLDYVQTEGAKKRTATEGLKLLKKVEWPEGAEQLSKVLSSKAFFNLHPDIK